MGKGGRVMGGKRGRVKDGKKEDGYGWEMRGWLSVGKKGEG